MTTAGTFVKGALTIYEKILISPVLTQIIVMQETRDGQTTLWNNIVKLAFLAAKAVDVEERKWVMDALEDLQANGGYSSDDLSRNISQGDRTHVGIIALVIFKLKVLRRRVGYAFIAIGLRPEDVTQLQERTKSHQEYTAATSPDADQSWLGKLQPAAVTSVRLLTANTWKDIAHLQASKSHSQLRLSCTDTSGMCAFSLCLAGECAREGVRQ